MFIALSIMFGLVAATLALTKGRRAWAWFMAGFVMGPFAFLVLALPDKPAHFGAGGRSRAPFLRFGSWRSKS
jgi:hypothetical protein